ncbi:Transmembrane E3 ubiquitin-protein ligase 1 [Colletotrichum sp. SAR11_239]|nr:Transmembrane E3 ubiquitin-protein ligase 1 [Colletotrichum sp. SAR 10_75]KAI8247950.1 Transmembrane E3 ubiquitin-protein ligase 1 [Colletotrichum sp. SAR 10_77]KAI8254773.1 Transmembrane E3 ubiquitin-protein ligase 1 [Colletotrichum sp. SAR11_239]
MPYPHEDPRIVVIGLALIGILWIFLAPGNGGASLFSASDLATQRLRRHQHALELLNASSWGNFSARRNGTGEEELPRSLNITGFRAEDGFAWDDLERFQERCLEWSRNAIPPVGGVNLWDIGQGEAVWQNATGAVKGTWVRKDASVKRQWTSYNLSAVTPSLHWSGAEADWARNITGDEGKMLLDVIDTGRHTKEFEYESILHEGVPTSGGRVRSAKASLTVEDVKGTGFNWEMRLHGVQWPRQGTLLLTTTSEKFDGIFGLPHLSPSSDFFQSSQLLLNATLSEVLRRKEKEVFNDGVMPWTSDPSNPPDTLNPSPHCEYIMYAQVHPPDRSRLNMKGFQSGREGMSQIISDIEQELRFPNGAPIRGVPELKLSAIIWSPDCGFFLETKGPPDFPPADGQHLQGMKTEIIYYKIRVWILAFAGVIIAQALLLKHQMRESATPSTMGRISYNTISMMVMVDGSIFAAASMWALDASITYLESLSLLFAAFLSMSMGGFFLAEIHKVQEPENRRRSEREQAETPRTPATPAQNLEADSLPRPVTAGPRRRAPTPPVIVPSDQDIDADIDAVTNGAAAVPNAGAATRAGPEVTFQAVIFRFAMIVSLLLLVSIASTSWYPRIRNGFVNTLSMVYFSFWVPQIHRNVIRNCRRALTWRFMIGQSILRLLPFAYFYVYEDNFLFAETDVRAFLVFCAWLWIQLWILAFQFVLGPRFGVPKSWTPDAWDYHPVLREDGVEAGGLPIGLLSEPGSPSLDRVRTGEDKKGSNLRAIDCAICREVLEVPVMRAGEEDPTAGGVVGVFTRRNYMVTPCRHIFHSACLEGWMRFRLQCPICREELPPL